MSIFNSQFSSTAPWVAAMTTESLPEVPEIPAGQESAAGHEALPPLPATDPADDAWLHRSDTTDIGTGGDDGVFYLVDGDTSLIVDLP